MRHSVRTSIAAAIVWTVAQLCGGGSARADEPPITVAHGLSAYEEDTLSIAEKSKGLTRDLAPEGKTIESIEFGRFDVLDPRDPLPVWLDIFHTLTRIPTLKREVLIHVGQLYQQDLADETARNLRGFFQLSLVLVQAEKGSSPDKVKLIIVTKDVWSLRLNWDAAIGNGGVESLSLQQTEINLAGTWNAVSTTFIYLPKSLTFGVGFNAPRLDGHWLNFNANAAIIIHSTDGHAEGTAGSASIARPLYSTRTEWSYGVGTNWALDVARRYIKTDVALYKSTIATSADVPWEWNERSFTETAGITRSYGVRFKNDFSTGGEINVRAYRYPDEPDYLPGGTRPTQAAINQFLQVEAPVSDTRVGPFVQWHNYKTDFLRLLDIDTLSLQEDFRLGLDTYVRLYPVTKALGSSRDFVGSFVASQYTWPLGDGIARVYLEATTEAETSRISDAQIDGDVHVTTPTIGFGRLVADAYVLDRWRNSLNQTVVLGGDTRLRGYPNGFFLGRDLVSGNLEYRTHGVDIHKVILGAVAFYDVGDAFDSFSSIALKQSVGGGLRAVFPQFERTAIRLDVGVPLTDRAAPGVTPVSFFITAGQAFGVGSDNVPGAIGTNGAVGAVLGTGVLNN